MSQIEQFFKKLVSNKIFVSLLRHKKKTIIKFLKFWIWKMTFVSVEIVGMGTEVGGANLQYLVGTISRSEIYDS